MYIYLAKDFDLDFFTIPHLLPLTACEVIGSPESHRQVVRLAEVLCNALRIIDLQLNFNLALRITYNVPRKIDLLNSSVWVFPSNSYLHCIDQGELEGFCRFIVASEPIEFYSLLNVLLAELRDVVHSHLFLGDLSVVLRLVH